MSICSQHIEPDPQCGLCQTGPSALFSDWNEKLAQAQAAGTVTCECGFEHYRTVDHCPLCERKSATRTD